MNGDDAEVMTIDELCAVYRISRSAFYQLRRRGEGPPVIKFGAAVRISKASAAKWARERERAER
jgi:predicted DNA-binding transcriptional regulator AlpA